MDTENKYKATTSSHEWNVIIFGPFRSLIIKRAKLRKLILLALEGLSWQRASRFERILRKLQKCPRSLSAHVQCAKESAIHKDSSLCAEVECGRQHNAE